MYSFQNDYSEGAHPRVLQALTDTNPIQTCGYGLDPICEEARNLIRTLCAAPESEVHFLVGGTQTNLTVIASLLQPYEAVIAAHTGHVNCHETGAIEATGHKVCTADSPDGKVTPAMVESVLALHAGGGEHMVFPKLVYISDTTEIGTVYTKAELAVLRRCCDEHGLLLFMDGARLGSALTSPASDLTLPDLAALTDVFTIGGTKNGALFGEAVIMTVPCGHFRWHMKQRGGMLAKGRLLGVQFEALLEGDLYFEISRHADGLADKIRRCLQRNHVPMYVENETNQIFPILPDAVLAQLQKTYVFTEQCRVDDAHRAVRICTSWATGDENVDRLCRDLDALLKAE